MPCSTGCWPAGRANTARASDTPPLTLSLRRPVPASTACGARRWRRVMRLVSALQHRGQLPQHKLSTNGRPLATLRSFVSHGRHPRRQGRLPCWIFARTDPRCRACRPVPQAAVAFVDWPDQKPPPGVHSRHGRGRFCESFRPCVSPLRALKRGGAGARQQVPPPSLFFLCLTRRPKPRRATRQGRDRAPCT